jgi:DNA-binding beta-propeller fold protein YncE
MLERTASSGGVARRTPPRRRALAFVTADLQAHVVVASTTDGRVRRRIATREGPGSIEAAPGQAIVAHPDYGVVSVLDTGAMKVRRVLEGFGEPAYTAVAPDGRHAYVSDSGLGELAVIELRRGRIVARSPVGDDARHLSISPDGRRLWVALGMEAPEVVAVSLGDPVRPRVEGRLELPFLAHDVVCAPDGRRLWVTSGTERRIALYAPGRTAPLKTVSSDAAPQHVRFGHGNAYVASGDDGALVTHDAATGSVTNRDRLPVGSFNISGLGDLLVSPSLEQGTVTVADPSGRVLLSRRIADAAHDACLV